MIQKFKIIYTYMATTVIKDFRSDKIVLKAKFQTQSEEIGWSPDLMRKLMISNIPIHLRV
jgi:hypothetical protein